MASRVLLGRLLSSSLVLAGVGLSCGGGDDKTDVPPSSDAGEAGEVGTVAGSGGSDVLPSAGRGGSSLSVGGQGGAGAGDGGTPPVVGGMGGATTDGGAASDGGQAGAGGDSGTSACISEGSRITIAFDANNPEWVKNLQWQDSAGATIPNVAVSGGTAACGDPSEFFGQAIGVTEQQTPNVVTGGSRATAVACGLDVSITSTASNCLAAAQIPWSTEYRFFDGPKASQMRVTRTLGFNAASPKFSGVGVRPWVPRVSRTAFPNTIYPNGAGTAVTTKLAADCGGDCLTAVGETWNGQWFADIGPTGLAIIVRRDPSMTSPVNLTVNWDSFSLSNLSSFVLMQPMDGWKAPITEVEYLCFADLVSWPQTERDAAQLPTFCGP